VCIDQCPIHSVCALLGAVTDADRIAVIKAFLATHPELRKQVL
jgi:hypothetical protein